MAITRDRPEAAPLKPVVSAYSIYIQEESKKLKEEGRLPSGSGGIMKELGPKFKSMSAAEKAPYAKKAKEIKEKYEKEMDAWKAKQSTK